MNPLKTLFILFTIALALFLVQKPVWAVTSCTSNWAVGDIDCNGIVDSVDFVQFKNQYLQQSSATDTVNADCNADSHVTLIDVEIVRSNLGYTVPSPTVQIPSSTPSPAPANGPLFFVHYYIWWDSSHWHAKLGANYPYTANPLPLPATLSSDGCTATTSYSGNTLIDIPDSSLNLYNQDDAAVLTNHVQRAAGIGVRGFVVSWSGNGTTSQTASSSKFNSRLNGLVNVITQYNSTHASAPFYLMIGYQGLDNSRNPRPITYIQNDLSYFKKSYGSNSVFLVPQYGNKPVVMLLDSRKFTPDQVKQLMEPYNGIFTRIGDEHLVGGINEWNRGVAPYFDGNSWYWSQQNPYTNPGSFTQIKAMGALLHSQNKLWLSPLNGGYNKSNFALGGACTPRKNGQTVQVVYNGNKQSNPDGYMYISWNEFLENTYVEPSLLYGSTILDALKNVIANP